MCGHDINMQGFSKFRHGHGTSVGLDSCVRQNHPVGAQASVHEKGRVTSTVSVSNQKFAAVKEWSSNYVHARFWSEWIKLNAIFGSFLSNSSVYLASEVFTLAFI